MNLKLYLTRGLFLRFGILWNFFGSIEIQTFEWILRAVDVCVSAILAVKEESLLCVVPKPQPVLEEFIPMKKECYEEEQEDQKNWMSSVQLWKSDRKRDSKFETKV